MLDGEMREYVVKQGEEKRRRKRRERKRDRIAWNVCEKVSMSFGGGCGA